MTARSLTHPSPAARRWAGGLLLILLAAGALLALIARPNGPTAGQGAVNGVAAPLRQEPAVAPLPVAAPPQADPAPALPVINAPLSRMAALLAAAQTAQERAAAPDPTQPLVLHYGPPGAGWVFQLTTDQLQAATVQKAKDRGALDRERLRAYLKPVAAALESAPRDATLILKGGQAILTPDVAGLALDVEATLARIEKAASVGQAAGGRVAEVALKAVPAAVQAATLRPIANEAQSLLDRGFTLRYNGEQYKLKPATLNRFLTLNAQDDKQRPYTIGPNHDKLLATLDLVAQQVNVPARDPLYRLVDNRVQEVIAARPGKKLDYAATAAAMEAAFNNGQNSADMVVTVREPGITAADTANIQTPDLLARASTSFSGSSSARAYNVRFGATLLDGMLIPPGAIFSLNDALGPLTLARGFKMGYGIARDANGKLTTVPSEAGGICQVATTFFQSTYWAGLPVVERRNHSYWIARYGEGSTGRRGLDATISPPDQDLRVRNTTGNWIRIRAFSNGETVLFELFGSNPGWTIKVSDPIIKNVVPTSEARIDEKSDLLPKGETVMVEHAQPGFTATITRRVYAADGTLLDNLTLTSKYEPAYNRYLTGTGKAVPKP